MQIRHIVPNCLRGFAVAVLALGFSGRSLNAGTVAAPTAPASTCPLADWWNGKYMTGNWFGLRDTLGDVGLTFNGKYYGAYFGVVQSQGGARGFWDEGIEFGAEQNFGKLLRVDALDGVKGFAQFRYRDSQADANPNRFVEASSLFAPTNWYSGTQFRVLQFGLEIGTGEHLPVKDMVVLRGGWLQPQKEFIDQPLSKLFLNNAVNSAKGVGGNIPFSSSFSTWGGTLKIKPLEWYYLKGGLFMSYPEATASGNHGLAYQGYGPDTHQNGLMAMFETGITPKIGPSKLPGKYAVGGYYYGGAKKSFLGTQGYGQYGMYLQADQMLFREPSEEAPVLAKGPSDGKSVASGKDFKSPVAPEKPKLSDQGLSMFSLVTLAPKYNNLYPFYFQTGFVYTGLIPHRDEDLTMFSIAYGSYSYYNIENLQNKGNVNQPNYTIFLEAGYRFQINKWAFVQPFIQYEIRPAGTGAVANATILGFSTGLTF
ncbi:MAG: carbohydrate porin [Verrucomicrobia bacterium]|nr:carbohydrate porin [Verrucomicrobiota bacterium]